MQPCFFFHGDDYFKILSEYNQLIYRIRRYSKLGLPIGELFKQLDYVSELLSDLIADQEYIQSNNP